ncbi:DUF1801 domain-containing protein [Pelagovum pacificum]|uniref:DUF1801 domain-containing protein n=1 Tax=Pelagovum pacificum TaxID=2588711 RepID=A0A5C5GE14_9RHOB|nr:DUF1801 domain-containing protein [Pelagovum pacificum]QQA41348.1 DUF1801 domain-containing protein [Pelagovum pacificum]TNY31846.1 DUF1801 domain-containing protein [Pelagovum pacificum]
MTDGKVKLLSGGNPQIPKGDGDGPVQDYIAAMPGWKHDAGVMLDRIITDEIGEAQKAVRWNTPFYGLPGQGYIVAFHCITKYLKITFFRGADLSPMPPVGSKDPNTRYLHVYEDLALDEAQFRDWIRQAAALPGWQF